jgi:hypothetical protein
MSEQDTKISWTCISEDMQAPPPRCRFSVECTLDRAEQVVTLTVEDISRTAAGASGVRATHTVRAPIDKMVVDTDTKQIFMKARMPPAPECWALYITDKDTSAAVRKALFDANRSYWEDTTVE